MMWQSTAYGHILWTVILTSSLLPLSWSQHVPAYFETLSLASSILSASEQEGQQVIQHELHKVHSMLLSPMLFQHELLDKVNLGLLAGNFSRLITVNVSDTCSNHTAQTIVALTERKPWALSMLDAMGKPGPNLQDVNLNWPGSYQECLSLPVQVPYASHDNHSTDLLPFPVQYCTASWQITGPTPQLPIPLTISIGTCAPHTCSTTDITVLLYTVLAELGVEKPVVYTVCQEPNKTLDGFAWAGIAVCGMFVALMMIGTALDVLYTQLPKWHTQRVELVTNSSMGDVFGETKPLLLGDQAKSKIVQPGFAVKLLMCFSVYTNGAKLLSTKQTADTLSCIHGIRVLSMTWVVLGHAFLMPAGASSNLFGYVGDAVRQWTFQAICNATVSVDTFFVLSGLLVAYLSLKEMRQRAGKLNWFLFYFHRFWRLTPPYMLIIVVYMCLGRYWGSGPLWLDEQGDRDNCRTSWWANMLYINNFVDLDKICLGQSWYLANDMQFYVLSPLIFVPLYYSPLVGLVSALFFLVASTVIPAALTVNDHLPPAGLVRVDASSTGANYQEVYYIKPYCRMGPYIVGMLTGYLLYHTDCRLRINKFVNLAFWAVAAASALAVLYGLYHATQGHPVSLPVSALYNGVGRTVWGACVAWVIFACITGNGGFVNTLLSWKALVPLSRLTYCIYLLHIMMLYAYVYCRETLFFYSDANVVVLFLACLVACYMVSAVVSLAFEAPMMALEKLFLPPRTGQT